MEESYSLHNLLPDMGMSSIFSNSANLTKLSNQDGLKVSEVSFPWCKKIFAYSNTCSWNIFFNLYCKITGAAQGCDRGGRDRHHCSSCHNLWHYSIFLTPDLHYKQTIFLLHIPWRHKLSAVYGQGDWPYQKLAVMTVWVLECRHEYKWF